MSPAWNSVPGGGIRILPTEIRRWKLSPHARQADSRRRPFSEHIAAEDEELGGAAPGQQRLAARPFDQPPALDEAAEVLLVEADSGEGLDEALELEEREARGEQLEDHRAVLELAAQAAESAREDAAVVEPGAEPQANALRCGLLPLLVGVAVRLFDQLRLVEQLVALEHALAVPDDARQAEGDVRSFAPFGPGREIGRRRDPALDAGDDRPVDDLRPAAPPVLPGEEGVDVVPARLAGAVRRLLSHQGEVADRDGAASGARFLRVAQAIAEGVELLDVAELEAGLLAH